MADEYLTKSDIIDWIEDWTNKNPRLYDILNILWMENHYERKNTLSKVNVLFSSSKLLIEFLKDPYFEGRKLIIKGEALSCGFDAYPSTMQWLKPDENEEIDEQKRSIFEM